MWLHWRSLTIGGPEWPPVTVSRYQSWEGHWLKNKTSRENSVQTDKERAVVRGVQSFWDASQIAGSLSPNNHGRTQTWLYLHSDTLVKVSKQLSFHLLIQTDWLQFVGNLWPCPTLILTAHLLESPPKSWHYAERHSIPTYNGTYDVGCNYAVLEALDNLDNLIGLQEVKLLWSK